MNLIHGLQNITQESLLKEYSQMLHISEVGNKFFFIFDITQMQTKPTEVTKYSL